MSDLGEQVETTMLYLQHRERHVERRFLSPRPSVVSEASLRFSESCALRPVATPLITVYSSVQL